jgi:hypothetical protein
MDAAYLSALSALPNKAILEFNELIMSGSGIDRLKEFDETAREEPRALSSL